MRLTPEQQTAILAASAEAFGVGAGVWLFGSRADDHKKGGDINPFIKLPVKETCYDQRASDSSGKPAMGSRPINICY